MGFRVFLLAFLLGIIGAAATVNEWTSIDTTIPAELSNLIHTCSDSYNGKLYWFGGVSNRYSMDPIDIHSKLWEYDTATQNYEYFTETNGPPKTQRCSLVVKRDEAGIVDDFVAYVIGGRLTEWDQRTPTVYKFTSRLNTWSVVADSSNFPTYPARTDRTVAYADLDISSATATLIDGSIYVYGVRRLVAVTGTGGTSWDLLMADSVLLRIWPDDALEFLDITAEAGQTIRNTYGHGAYTYRETDGGPDTYVHWLVICGGQQTMDGGFDLYQAGCRKIHLENRKWDFAGNTDDIATQALSVEQSPLHIGMNGDLAVFKGFEPGMQEGFKVLMTIAGQAKSFAVVHGDGQINRDGPAIGFIGRKIYMWGGTDQWGGGDATKVYMFEYESPPGTHYHDADQSVEICMKGAHASGWGLDSCTTCNPGTYADERASSECKNCSIGYEAMANREGCRQCSTGTYAPTVASPSCLDCEAGTFQFQEGQGSCDDCELGTFSETTRMRTCDACAAGFFANDTGLNECLPCAINMTSTVGATSEGDCRCAAGNYGSFSTGCTICPQHGNCSLDNPYPLPEKGYWATPEDPFSFMECLPSESCSSNPPIVPYPLNKTMSYCAQGYHSRLCGECVSKDAVGETAYDDETEGRGYFRLLGNCMPCPAGSSTYSLLIVLVMSAFLFVILKLPFTLSGRMQVLMTFLQFAAMSGILFQMNWPPILLQVLRILNISTFNVDILFGGCRMSPEDAYEFNTQQMFMLPIYFAGVFIVMMLLGYIKELVLGDKLGFISPFPEGYKMNDMLAHTVAAYFSLLAYLYIPLVSRAFELVYCREEEDGSKTFVPYPAQECNSAWHDELKKKFTPFMYIYPYGIPILFTVLIIMKHKDYKKLADEEEKNIESRALQILHVMNDDSLSKKEKRRLSKQLQRRRSSGGTRRLSSSGVEPVLVAVAAGPPPLQVPVAMDAGSAVGMLPGTPVGAGGGVAPIPEGMGVGAMPGGPVASPVQLGAPMPVPVAPADAAAFSGPQQIVTVPAMQASEFDESVRPLTHKWYSYFFIRYETSKWYWEIISLAVKFIFVLSIVLFPGDPVMQVGVVMLALLLNVFGTAFIGPYYYATSDVLSFALTSANFVLCFFGLLFFSNRLESSDSVIFQLVAIFIMIVSGAAALFGAQLYEFVVESFCGCFTKKFEVTLRERERDKELLNICQDYVQPQFQAMLKSWLEIRDEGSKRRFATVMKELARFVSLETERRRVEALIAAQEEETKRQEMTAALGASSLDATAPTSDDDEMPEEEAGQMRHRKKKDGKKPKKKKKKRGDFMQVMTESTGLPGELDGREDTDRTGAGDADFDSSDESR